MWDETSSVRWPKEKTRIVGRQRHLSVYPHLEVNVKKKIIEKDNIERTSDFSVKERLL
jgi:hypothetical protein